MDNNMKDFNIIQENRNAMMQTIWDRRQKAILDKETAMERKISQVQQLARECGATEDTPLLWLGVLKIILSEPVINFFIGSKPEGRMAIIKHYAGVNN
jgi:hypothetical protein